MLYVISYTCFCCTKDNMLFLVNIKTIKTSFAIPASDHFDSVIKIKHTVWAWSYASMPFVYFILYHIFLIVSST